MWTFASAGFMAMRAFWSVSMSRLSKASWSSLGRLSKTSMGSRPPGPSLSSLGMDERSTSSVSVSCDGGRGGLQRS